MAPQSTVWTRRSADIVITELPRNRRRVRVQMRDPAAHVPFRECETSYGLGLIELLLEISGPSWLCDAILRDESPTYVQLDLELGLLSFLDADEFRGKRILDFGCGAGASTAILGRMFPSASVLGLELEAFRLDVARAVAGHHGLTNVSFAASPGPDELPADLGRFDFVVLSAVLEHLLPPERGVLLPALWRRLEDQGVLFVNATPHRWFPLELHTTGLPLLNYVPPPLARRLALRYSKRALPADASWQTLLRRGIRGSTQGELLRTLRRAGAGDPVPLRPKTGSYADVWYEASMQRRPMAARRAVRAAFAAVSRATRSPFTPSLTLAVRKKGS
jgi:2-polyprenyl-3-methyl-5-hydroxy-6-metoxy-1,4-benzoquinol methylase